MVKVVSVKFKNSSYGSNSTYTSKEYYYKTFFEVSAGEEVVVDTSTNGLQIAMVYNAEVEEPSLQKKATKYLVQKVDTTLYREKLKQEEELQSIKYQMDLKVKSLQETSIYEQLAKQDPALAELLGLYKEKLANM